MGPQQQPQQTGLLLITYPHTQIDSDKPKMPEQYASQTTCDWIYNHTTIAAKSITKNTFQK